MAVTVAAPNVLPAVSLAPPAGGTSYVSPSQVVLSATASDGDGSVARVDFYANGVLIGTASAAPYQVTWLASGAGTYALTAVATDNQGGTTTSSPVTVTLSAVPGQTITYLHSDFLGSALAATDEAGGVIWRENYQPYGGRQIGAAAAAGNRQWYTGKPVDAETGLAYFGARYYDAAIGRFLGVDPKGFDEANPHSFNRFAYANNNPYKFVDPDGRAAVLLPLIQAAVGRVTLWLAENQMRAAAAAEVSAAVASGAVTTPSGIATELGAAARGAQSIAGEVGAAKEAAPLIKAGSAGGETAGKAFPQAVKDAAKAENPLSTCVFCRTEGTATQVDHAIPRARGGNATLDNAQLACPHCNASKGARDFPVNPPPGYRGEWPPSHW